MSLPSKLRALWHYRPRILTLLLLFAVAAPIAMANFTSEIHQFPGRPSLGAVYARGTYGWPFMWHWHNLMATPALDVIAGWNYSGARLVANLACWSILLAAPAVACEWLLRQYRPRRIRSSPNLYTTLNASRSSARGRRGWNSSCPTDFGGALSLSIRECTARARSTKRLSFDWGAYLD